MVGFPEVDRIALRKRWIAMKCELSRQSLDESISGLRRSTTWIHSAMSLVRASGPVLILAAPLARFLMKRKPAAVKAWEGWQWLRKARGFLRKRRH